MAKPYVLTGTLRDELTVALDEALPLKFGRVRLTLEAVGPEPQKHYQEVLADIRRRQRARAISLGPEKRLMPAWRRKGRAGDNDLCASTWIALSSSILWSRSALIQNL